MFYDFVFADTVEASLIQCLLFPGLATHVIKHDVIAARFAQQGRERHTAGARAAGGSGKRQAVAGKETASVRCEQETTKSEDRTSESWS